MAPGAGARPPRDRSARQLIINADDLGLTAGVNRGIWEAFERGTVTSASLMANMPGRADAIHRIHQAQRPPDIGLHFNLTAGTPLVSVPTLTDPRAGTFYPLSALVIRAITGRLDRDEVVAECTAQLEYVRHAGVVVSHIDSHQHVHLLPGIWDAVAEVVARAGIRYVRVPIEPLGGLGEHPRSTLKKIALRVSLSRVSPDVRRSPQPHFRGTALLHTSRYLDRFLRLVDTLPTGRTELMVHPGYVDEELAKVDGYTFARERELRALVSRDTVTRLQRGDIRLGTFGGAVASL